MEMILFLLCLCAGAYFVVKIMSAVISCAEQKPPGWQPPEPESITVGYAIAAALCIPSRARNLTSAPAQANRRVIVARPMPQRIYVPDWPVKAPVRVEAKGRTK